MSQDLPRRLFEVICAQPDDDQARLVYADWHTEHGDGPRAEFIRVQLALAKLPAWDVERVRLELRARALLSEHEARWRAELPPLEGVTWGRFHRGFVSWAVFADAGALEKHAAACQAVTPLQGVAMRWAPARAWEKLGPIAGLRELTLCGPMLAGSDMDGLAQSPVLSTLRALNLVESRMGWEAFGRLLSSPHLQNLVALRIPHHHLSTLEELVGVSSPPALAELDLSVPTTADLGSGGRDTATLGSTAMRQLVAWPGMARLRSLDLSGNQLGARGLVALLSSPRAVGLKTLRMNGLAEEEPVSLHAFGKARPGLQLEELCLDGLDTEGADQLARARCLSELKALELPHILGDAGVGQALANSPWFEHLRTLDASYGDASNLLKEAFANAPARLHTLKLVSSLRWSPSLNELIRLASSPSSNGLLQLDLSFNNFAEQAAAALCEASGLQNLLFLGLRDINRVRAPVAERLQRSPLGQRLVSFELGQAKDGHDKLPRPRSQPIARGAYRGPLYER